jgi:hypothetical protein
LAVQKTNIMKKKTLLLLFFLGNLLVQGQTDYGVLIRSTMNPKNPNASSTRYTICGVLDYSIEGSIDMHIKEFCTNNIIPLNGAEKIQYDFFYTKNIDGLFILDAEINSRYQSICSKEYAIPYDKSTFKEATLGGCAGRSNVWSIHLTQPAANNVCSDDAITLNNGWNWQYQYDATGWKPLPSQFQGKRSISFSLKDIGGYDGKSQIFFQAGYQTQFTNTVTYKIIPCSPVLNRTSDPNFTNCSYSNGSVIFIFSRPLETTKEEKYLFNRNPVGSGPATSAKSDDPDVEKISEYSYKWKNIPPGQYEFKYQTQFANNTPSTMSAVTNFTITQNPNGPLTFKVKEVMPTCSEDTDEGIEISVSGGTPPYYYLLDGEPLAQKHPFISPYKIPIKTDGTYTVIVVDKYNCEE